jgi:hypothetical protein
MKWVSVKDAKPPAKKPLFIRYGSQWIACAYVEKGRFWACENCYEFENVTHFCVPDPVEAEND